MQPSDTDTTEILHLLGEQDAAWCAGDAAAFGARALPDIVFTNVVGLFSVGRRRSTPSTRTFSRPSIRAAG